MVQLNELCVPASRLQASTERLADMFFIAFAEVPCSSSFGVSLVFGSN